MESINVSQRCSYCVHSKSYHTPDGCVKCLEILGEWDCIEFTIVKNDAKIYGDVEDD